MDIKARRKMKWIIAAIALTCILLAVVMLVLVTNSNTRKNKQRAIELVKDYLDESDPTHEPGIFESWEATGDKYMMEVCATYDPHSEEGNCTTLTEEEPHVMKWQVNLRTGKVSYLESVDPDG